MDLDLEWRIEESANLVDIYEAKTPKEWNRRALLLAMSERPFLFVSFTYNRSFLLLQRCRLASMVLLIVLWMSLDSKVAGSPSEKRDESQCIRPTEHKM